MKFFKKKCYFFVFELDSTNLPVEIVNYIKKYLKYKLKKTDYFEYFSGEKNYVVIGTEEVGKKTNRNVLIFLLELYASLKDSNIKVSKDFKRFEKKIGEYTLTIYKFRRF